MSFMTAEDFEARYRADPDPWGYLASEYERRKYAATLAACGPGPVACALELGGSIGVFSAMLAPRCARLVTVDVSPTAVAHARSRLAGHPAVEPIVGAIPAAVPQLPFDLVVASEILYYLSDQELAGTLSLLQGCMVAGARLVAVHWRPRGPERPRDAEQAHAALASERWLTQVERSGTDDYLLEVFRR
jgi:cyclopropane fatty-acyl-phospholipid synthase-like methyltransferase